MSADGQGTKCRRNISENFNRLTRAHERYRQTDRRQTDGQQRYSEHERELASVKVSSRSLIKTWRIFWDTVYINNRIMQAIPLTIHVKPRLHDTIQPVVKPVVKPY